MKCSSTSRRASLVMPNRCSLQNSPATNETDYALKVAVIYQDHAGCHWAREICNRVQHAIREEALRIEAWSVDELNCLEPWCQAVEAASNADLIVVAARAEGQLPLDIGIWLDTWLPQRRARPGALIALLSVPDQPGFRPFQVQESLHEVAQKSHLDFFLQERLAAVKPASAREQLSVDATRWPAPPRFVGLQRRLNTFHSEGARKGSD